MASDARQCACGFFAAALLAYQLVRPLALLHDVLRGAAAREEIAGARALGVLALVDLCVRVSELDRDIPLELILEAHCVHSGNRLDDSRLAVSDVADGTCKMIFGREQTG